MLSFDSGCVVITGGGGLLGRGLALAFARRGASVVVADVNSAAAEAVAAEVAAVPGARGRTGSTSPSAPDSGSSPTSATSGWNATCTRPCSTRRRTSPWCS
jgi:3-oxoacyl-[acyl-carrier protein] reductase